MGYERRKQARRGAHTKSERERTILSDSMMSILSYILRLFFHILCFILLILIKMTFGLIATDSILIRVILRNVSHDALTVSIYLHDCEIIAAWRAGWLRT